MPAIFQDNPNLTNISDVFGFTGDPNPSGSCSYDFNTNVTTFNMSGTGQATSAGCTCNIPYSISFVV